MPSFTRKERLQYAVDNAFSKGTTALLGWLALFSIVIMFISASLVWLFGLAPGGDDRPDFTHLMWMAFMRMLDAGALGGDDGNWGYLFVWLVVTLGGIFILSVLIGLLTSGIESRLEALRKGRSKVIESNHTVILGWSRQVFSIISELVQANASQKNPCIVILAPKDKVEMEEEIRTQVPELGNTRVVCRTGNPIEVLDLAIASPGTARSIIVLSPECENPDVEVIKTLLALTKADDTRQTCHIVVEIQDPKNQEVVTMVGKDAVEMVLVGDLIARVIAQTCRQTGLSAVYTELLDFGGSEIYFHKDVNLANRTVGEVLLAYEQSAVIGYAPAGGTPQLLPNLETKLGPDDRVIVIAVDDSAVGSAGTSPFVDENLIRTSAAAPDLPEHTLILGWNRKGARIVKELDAYVPPGSSVKVVTQFPATVDDVLAEIHHVGGELTRQTVSALVADTSDRRVLDDLKVEGYNHIIILCYGDYLSGQQADAHTLVTLLHLREMASRRGLDLAIVSEMLDSRNRDLAEITQADDFIVSDRLVSLMLSQISENRQLNAVFADLFDPEGAEIYLKPVSRYVEVGKPVNFYTVVEAARRQGEIAFGYRTAPVSNGSRASVVVNPEKSQAVTFAPDDRIIVLAEE